MVKKIIFALLYTPIFVGAQPTIQWQKTFGGGSFDEAFSVKQTPDNGYIVVGSAASASGDVFPHYGGADYWVLKLDNLGSLEWKKTLGGTGNDLPYDIQNTFDGGYLVVGASESNDFDVTDNHGGYYDAWVVKLHNDGSIQWQRAFGGSERDEFWKAQQTADNGYILVGRTRSTDGDVTDNKGLFDLWVVKINENGIIEWQKTFGGESDDIGYAVKEVEDNGYIVIAETSSTMGDISSSHGNTDFWLLRLNGQGDLLWQKTYGGDSADIPSDIILAADGGFVLCGFVGSHNSGDVTSNEYLSIFDYWLIKIDSIGNLEWQKTAGGNQPDYARSIVAAPDSSGFLVAGGTSSSNGDVVGNDGGAESWLVKFSNNGEIIWQQTYGGTKMDHTISIDNASDSGYIMAGYTWSTDGDVTGSPNKGKDDFWIVKLSPESTPVHEAQSGKLDIFPNPASNSIYLQTTDNHLIENVALFNLLGETVLQQTLGGKKELDISVLPPGLYLVNAVTKDGAAFWGRVEKN